jgi:hypothetical protein
MCIRLHHGKCRITTGGMDVYVRVASALIFLVDRVRAVTRPWKGVAYTQTYSTTLSWYPPVTCPVGAVRPPVNIVYVQLVTLYSV